MDCAEDERRDVAMTTSSDTQEPTADDRAIMDRMVGARRRIIGDHPWSGNHGYIDRWEYTPFGWRPVVKMENGESCFVINPKHFRQVIA